MNNCISNDDLSGTEALNTEQKLNIEQIVNMEYRVDYRIYE